MINTKEMYLDYISQGLSHEEALKRAKIDLKVMQVAGVKNNKEHSAKHDNGFYRAKVRYVG